MRGKTLKLTVLTGATAAVSCATSTPKVSPLGQEQTPRTTMLEAGANVLQRDTPVDRMGIYLVGFHPMKEDPSHQMEAHHFCNQMNEDFMQCALFDANTKGANLNGVEFIISGDLYDELPPEEKQYWHPHNYEILSGQLVAPGIPTFLEKQLMTQKINSYGKTWHVWDTGNAIGRDGTRLPYGEPRLAWSFNRDGEAKEGLVESRDERMGFDTEEIRASRRNLVEGAEPQGGVDDLAGEFDGPTSPIPGVEKADKEKVSH